MTELNQVYQCNLCGNVTGVLHAGPGELVCCNQPMVLLTENTTDAATEKHVPVIEKTADGYSVSVGDVEHPMLEEHFIEWIELLADGQVYRKHLQAGEKPVGVFNIDAEKVSAREFCNLHGLWRKDS